MGLYGIAEVKMVKDNWNVEWKIEDETIAKCVPESGIENNEYGGTQIAGRASIQGLKEGTTKLLIKVKVSESKTKDFEVPITITGTENNDNKKDNNDLEDWQKELVKEKKYDTFNFEEEELEDDDYYSEDDDE